MTTANSPGANSSGSPRYSQLGPESVHNLPRPVCPGLRQAQRPKAGSKMRLWAGGACREGEASVRDMTQFLRDGAASPIPLTPGSDFEMPLVFGAGTSFSDCGPGESEKDKCLHCQKA
jgi:hypothetical protein